MDFVSSELSKNNSVANRNYGCSKLALKVSQTLTNSNYTGFIVLLCGRLREDNTSDLGYRSDSLDKNTVKKGSKTSSNSGGLEA